MRMLFTKGRGAITQAPDYVLSWMTFATEKSLYALLKTKLSRVGDTQVLLVGNSDCLREECIADFVESLSGYSFGNAYARCIIHIFDSGNIEIRYQRKLHLTLYVGDQKSVINHIAVKKTQRGVGRKFFHELIELCQRLRINDIKLDAAKGNWLNGYYTRARFGCEFDHSISDEENGYNRFLNIVQGSDDTDIQKVTTMHQLMGLGQKGRIFRREYGCSFQGVFDCTVGSAHLQMFYGSEG